MDHGLTDEELEEFRDIFNLVDRVSLWLYIIAKSGIRWGADNSICFDEFMNIIRMEVEVYRMKSWGNLWTRLA